MQGLLNFTTSLADGVLVLLPTLCYLMACSCFLFAAWTFRSWAYHGHGHQHHFHNRPWVPFFSLFLSGVFASFPTVLTMANVSAGTPLVASLTSYTPTVPGNAANLLGATPLNTVINVVALFAYFFQAFGAACVFRSLVTWRSIVNGTTTGSPSACAIQGVFGIMCINILTVSQAVMARFQTGG